MSVCDFVVAIYSLRTAYLDFPFSSMPIRAVVSPKFTYSQGKNFIYINRTAHTTYSFQNGMFDYNSIDDLSDYVFMPQINFPLPGNGHSARKSNRITVTSIRVKMHFTMDPVLLRMNSLHGTSYAYSGLSDNIPLNPTVFAKFRLFLVSVDDDIEVTRQKILNWFYATHCLYRQPSNPEELRGPSYTQVTPSPGPTSVHSNVLRTTTDWTGKFNILADRKFTVRTRKPYFDIDMTIPLRKEYVFDEDYTANSKLLYPKLYLFILPPLSYEVDVDPTSHSSYATSSTSSVVTDKMFTVYYWTKLNFVDL